ncbi:MAG: sigma-70 family RNA polymerase sigma factor [Terracidiphilus sp.]
MNLAEIPHHTNVFPLSLTEDPDGLLVAAALSGDASAFVELSRRHSRKLLLKIYRMTNNWQDAEDIVQEALMKAFTHLYTFESRASFSTWLTRIAINLTLMLLRKKRRSRTLCDDTFVLVESIDDVFEPRDHRENPEQTCARRQVEDKLERAMQRMRPKYREVIELREGADLQMSEIAESLSISVAAVKSRLLRARKELRRHVQLLSPT